MTPKNESSSGRLLDIGSTRYMWAEAYSGEAEQDSRLRKVTINCVEGDKLQVLNEEGGLIEFCIDRGTKITDGRTIVVSILRSDSRRYVLGLDADAIFGYYSLLERESPKISRLNKKYFMKEAAKLRFYQGPMKKGAFIWYVPLTKNGAMYDYPVSAKITQRSPAKVCVKDSRGHQITFRIKRAFEISPQVTSDEKIIFGENVSTKQSVKLSLDYALLLENLAQCEEQAAEHHANLSKTFKHMASMGKSYSAENEYWPSANG